MNQVLRGRRHSAVIYRIQHLIINMGVQGAKPPEASGIWTRGKLTEWKYRRFSLNCLKIQELQEVFIEIKDNFQSSQNTGGNCHFTGNTGITGLRATPATHPLLFKWTRPYLAQLVLIEVQLDFKIQLVLGLVVPLKIWLIQHTYLTMKVTLTVSVVRCRGLKHSRITGWLDSHPSGNVTCKTSTT